MLAVDPLLFIEDFSLDHDHQQPGFDQADDNPSTPPDRLLIQHSIQARGTAFVPVDERRSQQHLSAVITVRFRNAGARERQHTLAPHRHAWRSGGRREITAVAIGYSGLGTIRVLGDNGVKTINVSGPPSVWHSLTVTANSPSDAGQEVGAIQSVVVSTIEVIYIDDVALLVNGIIVNNPPVATPMP